MSFNHRVHEFDTKGKIKEIKPYTKVMRQGYPDIYFDHKKKRFFDPGTMKDMPPQYIPDDVWERYMGGPKNGTLKKAPAVVEEVQVEAENKAPKRRGRPKKSESEGLDEPILVTSKGVEE